MRVFKTIAEIFAPTPITRRRWAQFRANKRGYWSLWIFLVLFILTLSANFIANNKPLLVMHNHQLYAPFLKSYPETAFGGEFETEADYRDPFVREAVAARVGVEVLVDGLFLDVDAAGGGEAMIAGPDVLKLETAEDGEPSAGVRVGHKTREDVWK